MGPRTVKTFLKERLAKATCFVEKPPWGQAPAPLVIAGQVHCGLVVFELWFLFESGSMRLPGICVHIHRIQGSGSNQNQAVFFVFPRHQPDHQPD